jgi:hypothetical protein
LLLPVRFLIDVLTVSAFTISGNAFVTPLHQT